MNPQDLRKLSLDRLAALKRSRSWLADHPAVSCSRDSVLRWLAGTQELGAVHVGECLYALGLRVGVRQKI